MNNLPTITYVKNQTPIQRIASVQQTGDTYISHMLKYYETKDINYIVKAIQCTGVMLFWRSDMFTGIRLEIKEYSYNE